THNKTGRMLIKSSSSATGMYFSQAIASVWRTQSERLPTPNSTDRAAMFLLPVLLVLAAFAAYPTYAHQQPGLQTLLATLDRIASVLAVGTPATLALAAPLAFVFAQDRGEREGLLLQNPSAIESAPLLNAIALEQTGFITYGKLHVTGTFPSDKADEQTLLRYAMIALQNSDTPQAQAVAALAKSRKIAYPEADSCQFLPGKGMAARYGTETVRAGRIQWLRQEGTGAPEGIEDGCSLLAGVSVNARFLGCFRFSDLLRPSSKIAVAEAGEAALEPVIVSAEPEGHVTACALELGIKRRFFEIPPEKKAFIAAELRNQGLRAATLGAGLIDAQYMSGGEIG
ncbi:MAG TPA: HAD family hydrolase, partial [Elusimicrobiales bacterium]|nr:HAD family hydrolase [Elusimicrobiales bacterium]